VVGMSHTKQLPMVIVRDQRSTEGFQVKVAMKMSLSAGEPSDKEPDGGSCQCQSCRGEKTAGQNSRLVISKMKCAWLVSRAMIESGAFGHHRLPF
jgi:hypothetical protein